MYFLDSFCGIEEAKGQCTTIDDVLAFVQLNKDDNLFKLNMYITGPVVYNAKYS